MKTEKEEKQREKPHNKQKNRPYNKGGIVYVQ